MLKIVYDQFIEAVKDKKYSAEYVRKHGNDQEKELHEFLEKH